MTTSNGQRKPGNIQNIYNQPTTPGAGQIRPPPVSPPTPQYYERFVIIFEFFQTVKMNKKNTSYVRFYFIFKKSG